MLKILKVLIAVLMVSNTIMAQQEVIFLYDGNAPGLKPNISISESDVSTANDGISRLRHITKPSLTVYKPSKNNTGSSVIICPGGGYQILAWNHEGTDLGEWFAKRGVTAFVLKYRLPQDELFEEAGIRPLEDAQQAIRLVRRNAAKYKLKADKIGIMGFSAGGHLAACASNMYNEQIIEDAFEDINVRPDFSILIYPVISFSDKHGHMGSRNNLIGKNPSVESIDKYSLEKQVTSNTPPTFLVHAIDDPVLPENSIQYLRALKTAGIKAELHVFDSGGHGFSLRKAKTGTVSNWDKRLEEWMKWNNWM